MVGGGRRPDGFTIPHVRAQLPWIAAAFVFTSAVAALAVAANRVSEGGITVLELFSDPAEVEGFPWYVGAVHDLNLFVWVAGATSFLVAAVGLRGRDTALSRALAWLGLFTVLFLLDDRFMLHEVVYPWLLGAQETVVFVVYALLLGVLLVVFRQTLMRQPECILAVVGLLGLGASVALDVLGIDHDARRVAEEVAKLLGATAWAMFPAAIIVRHLRSSGRGGT